MYPSNDYTIERERKLLVEQENRISLSFMQNRMTHPLIERRREQKNIWRKRQ